MLSIETKTRIVDLQDLLATMDRRLRLLPAIGKAEGWDPRHFGSLLVLPEETWARNRLRQYAAVFDAALPARTVEIRRWLAEPADPISSPHGQTGRDQGFCQAPHRPR